MLMKNAQNRVIITSDLKNHTVSGHTIYIEEIKDQTATWEKHTSISYLSNNPTWKFVSYLYDIFVSVFYNLHRKWHVWHVKKTHFQCEHDSGHLYHTTFVHSSFCQSHVNYTKETFSHDHHDCHFHFIIRYNIMW